MKFLAATLTLLALTASATAARPAIRAPVPPPPAPEGVSGEELLPGLVKHSAKTARIENGRLAGEDHGSAGIAQFVEALWRDLNELGFDHLAVETDPFVAAKMERTLREGGLSAWAAFHDAQSARRPAILPHDFPARREPIRSAGLAKRTEEIYGVCERCFLLRTVSIFLLSSPERRPLTGLKALLQGRGE
jgi:hypothetical protein